MMSGPSQPGQMEMSIGGDRIPFTMQAEASQMTIEEAVASRLFDMPDEPGMVRIPISMNAMIPGHLLQPPEPEPTAGHDQPHSSSGVPPRAPGRPPRRRFGNYSQGHRRTERDGQLQVADVAGCGGTRSRASGRDCGRRRPWCGHGRSEFRRRQLRRPARWGRAVGIARARADGRTRRRRRAAGRCCCRSALAHPDRWMTGLSRCVSLPSHGSMSAASRDWPGSTIRAHARAVAPAILRPGATRGRPLLRRRRRGGFQAGRRRLRCAVAGLHAAGTAAAACGVHTRLDTDPHDDRHSDGQAAPCRCPGPHRDAGRGGVEHPGTQRTRQEAWRKRAPSHRARWRITSSPAAVRRTAIAIQRLSKMRLPIWVSILTSPRTASDCQLAFTTGSTSPAITVL
jgi:hypothetical protein